MRIKQELKEKFYIFALVYLFECLNLLKSNPLFIKKKSNKKSKNQEECNTLIDISNVNKFSFKIEDKKFSINKKQTEISIFQNDFLEKLISTNLPINLIEYYLHYNLSKSCDTNIFIGSYKFYSINEILKRNKILYDNTIPIIEFASRYDAMGFIKIFYYDYIEYKYYVRVDGGSNKYECEENWDKLIEYYHYKYNVNNKLYNSTKKLNLWEFEKEVSLNSILFILYPFLSEFI